MTKHNTVEEIQAEIDLLNEEMAELLESQKKLKNINWPQTVSYYVNSDKDTNYEIAEQLGLSDNGTRSEDNPGHKFAYTCYEIELTLKVYEDGSAFVTHLEGVALSHKVQVN